MKDIPTPVLIGAVVLVVVVALLARRNDGGGVSVVPTDPGAVELSEAETAAKTQAFSALAALVHDVTLGKLDAGVQTHAIDVAGETEQHNADVAGRAAETAAKYESTTRRYLADLQADMMRDALAVEQALGASQTQAQHDAIDAQRHADNLGFWGNLLDTGLDVFGSWLSGRAGASHPGTSGRGGAGSFASSAGGFRGGLYVPAGVGTGSYTGAFDFDSFGNYDEF